MCHETVSYCKPDGDFRKVLVSPEIVTSQEFYRVVLSKDSYSSLLRVVDVDKAHCINIWGCSKQTTRVLVYFEGNFRRSFRICHAPRACQHKLITISTFLPSKGTLLFFAKPNLKKLIQNGCHQYSRQAVIRLQIQQRLGLLLTHIVRKVAYQILSTEVALALHDP